MKRANVRGLLAAALALAATACGSTLYVGGDIHPVRPATVRSGWVYVVGDPVAAPAYSPYVVYGPGVVSY